MHQMRQSILTNKAMPIWQGLATRKSGCFSSQFWLSIWLCQVNFGPHMTFLDTRLRIARMIQRSKLVPWRWDPFCETVLQVYVPPTFLLSKYCSSTCQKPGSSFRKQFGCTVGCTGSFFLLDLYLLLRHFRCPSKIWTTTWLTSSCLRDLGHHDQEPRDVGGICGNGCQKKWILDWGWIKTYYLTLFLLGGEHRIASYLGVNPGFWPIARSWERQRLWHFLIRWTDGGYDVMLPDIIDKRNR